MTEARLLKRNGLCLVLRLKIQMWMRQVKESGTTRIKGDEDDVQNISRQFERVGVLGQDKFMFLSLTTHDDAT